MIAWKELSQYSPGLGRLIIEIVSAATEADVYSIVARNLPDVLPAHRATVVLRAETSDLLKVIALRGDDGCMPLGELLSSRKTVVGQVIESGLSRIWVPDPQSPKIDESQLARQGMRSIMNVPIRVGQKVIGSINVASRDWDAYGAIEQHILLQVAALLGSCIDRIRLATGMDILSRTDALTGLANRVALQQYLQDSLAGKGAAIGLLFIDLVHNHPSGDHRPSENDTLATRKLSQVGRALDVLILDHIVVTATHAHHILSERVIGNVTAETSAFTLRSEQPPDVNDSDLRQALQNAQLTLRRRILRRQLLGHPKLFGEPAWEMLLDIFIHECDGKSLAMSSLCVAVGIPTSSAMKLAQRLCDTGLLIRIPDPSDGRRSFMKLAPEIAHRMHAYFSVGAE